MKPENFAERLMGWQSLLIYPIYFAGALFPVNTIVPWILLIYAIIQQFNRQSNPQILSWRSTPLHLWSWAVLMSCMGLVILIGVQANGYNTNEIIRSALGWMRDWALLGIYPLVGYWLPIRPAVIYRSACVIAAQSLVMIPICYGAFAMKLPATIYVSGLERITQNGPIYYNIAWYMRDVDSDGVRLVLFTPWGPALGLMGCLFFIYALQERHRIWKSLGLLGSIAMIVTSVSRGAFLFLPMTIALVWSLENLSFIQLQLTLGTSCFVGGLSSAVLAHGISEFLDGFKGARKSSSKVREELERVALDRWMNSPVFGHGKPVPGPEFLKKMPIGSHHTWIGLLFTQGILGFFAFLIPLVWTIGILVSQVRHSTIAKVALSGLLLIALASFSDNIEKLSYLYWSAFLLIGIAARPLPRQT